MVVAAAVAQSDGEFAQQVEGWMFEFQPRKTLVVQTGNASLTVKHSVKV